MHSCREMNSSKSRSEITFGTLPVHDNFPPWQYSIANCNSKKINDCETKYIMRYFIAWLHKSHEQVENPRTVSHHNNLFVWQHDFDCNLSLK